MFDIGWSELLVIGVVALIAIGPKELPGVLRTVGQWMGKIRRMASEFQGQFQEAMREAEMADIKKQVDEMTGAASDASPTSIRSATSARQFETAIDDKPADSRAASETRRRRAGRRPRRRRPRRRRPPIVPQDNAGRHRAHRARRAAAALRRRRAPRCRTAAKAGSGA